MKLANLAEHQNFLNISCNLLHPQDSIQKKNSHKKGLLSWSFSFVSIGSV